MAIDKNEKRQREDSKESSRPSFQQTMWVIVALFVFSVFGAFIVGVWSHLIVEFFNQGWGMAK
jgi:hypothetical protein